MAGSGKQEESEQGSFDEVEELCNQNTQAREMEGEGGSVQGWED